MKLLRHLLLLFICLPLGTAACPFCNIHNYMASSILESERIFIGTVTSGDKHGIKVKVIESLKGEHAPGEMLERYETYLHTGDTVIFCDMPIATMPPSFDLFQVRERQEILFLLRGDTMPANLAEAEACLLGVSASSPRAGIAYFHLHPEEGITHLSRLLDSLLALSDQGIDLQFASWRIGSLCKAWSSNPVLLASDKMTEQLEKTFAGRDKVLKGTKRIDPAYHAGYLYACLLDSTGQERQQLEKHKALLMAYLPQANARVASNIAFALVSQKALSQEEWLQVKRHPNQDAIAWGCLRASQEASSWWQWKEADRCLQMAKECSYSHWLFQELKWQEDWVNRMMKR